MKRQTPRNFGDLIALVQLIMKGLARWGGVLDVRATTAAIMGPMLTAACRSNAEYRRAITAAIAATAEQNVWFEKAGTFITLVRENLKPTLGSRYNEGWGAVGWCNDTLAVPRTFDLRMSLVKMMELFFLKHPELEIPNVASAALAKGLFDGATNAGGVAMAARAEQRRKKVARDKAVTVLRQRIQGLRAELKLLLSPSDPRWLDFGFKVPTDVRVTEAPADLKLTLEDKRLKASWSHTVHADRYRVYQRVIGKDAEPVPVDTTRETWFDLGIYEPGTELEVEVTAINSAGESRASEVARFMVPKEE